MKAHPRPWVGLRHDHDSPPRPAAMLELFLHPWTMAAGAALVSTPIIIHLINRMRFRRVKWAAMELLLKAHKRMRRQQIVEQLILLMLRRLLVFLIGPLFSPHTGP